MGVFCGHFFLIMYIYVEWHMSRLVVKNGHQIDTCYSDIGICVQIDQLRSSCFHSWDGLCYRLYRMRIFN